jgi:hypothetical protein
MFSGRRRQACRPEQDKVLVLMPSKWVNDNWWISIPPFLNLETEFPLYNNVHEKLVQKRRQDRIYYLSLHIWIFLMVEVMRPSTESVDIHIGESHSKGIYISDGIFVTCAYCVSEQMMEPKDPIWTHFCGAKISVERKLAAYNLCVYTLESGYSQCLKHEMIEQMWILGRWLRWKGTSWMDTGSHLFLFL